MPRAREKMNDFFSFSLYRAQSSSYSTEGNTDSTKKKTKTKKKHWFNKGQEWLKMDTIQKDRK